MLESIFKLILIYALVNLFWWLITSLRSMFSSSKSKRFSDPQFVLDQVEFEARYRIAQGRYYISNLVYYSNPDKFKLWEKQYIERGGINPRDDDKLAMAARFYAKKELARGCGFDAEYLRQNSSEDRNTDIPRKDTPSDQKPKRTLRKKPTVKKTTEPNQRKTRRRQPVLKTNRVSTPGPLKELDGLIGLDGVKRQMESVAALVKVMKAREAKGFKVGSDSYHLIFTGNPGTGKTTVARIVGKIFRDLGVVKKGHVVEKKRQDMGGEWRGDGAKYMQKAIEEAMDGVLFLDEIYNLHHGKRSGHDDSLGTEMVNTLLTGLEDNRDRLVVIGAGYKKETEDFLKTNPGMSSRFKTFIHFPDFSPSELFQIFELQCKTNEYILTASAIVAAKKAIEKIYAQRDEHFGNGREMRNFFEDCRRRQAMRLQNNMPDDAGILLLEVSDIVDKFGGKDISEDANVNFHENDELKRLEKENEELEKKLSELDGKIKTQKSRLQKEEQKTDTRRE